MYLFSAFCTGTTTWVRGHPSSRVRSFSVTAPAKSETVSRLRSFLCTLFPEWPISPDDQACAELVISELLTNAVLHGHAEMTLAVTHAHSTLEITVADHGRPKEIIPYGDPDEHGRGLAIVAAVTRDLSIDERTTGWHVRACLDLHPSAPDPVEAHKVSPQSSLQGW